MLTSLGSLGDRNGRIPQSLHSELDDRGCLSDGKASFSDVAEYPTLVRSPVILRIFLGKWLALPGLGSC